MLPASTCLSVSANEHQSTCSPQSCRVRQNSSAYRFLFRPCVHLRFCRNNLETCRFIGVLAFSFSCIQERSVDPARGRTSLPESCFSDAQRLIGRCCGVFPPYPSATHVGALWLICRHCHPCRCCALSPMLRDIPNRLPCIGPSPP